ncbi:MAG: class I SAM-dependent methyltransferase [Anaerolineales bacterium]|nr:class I SAM-dependent methyltransferase [Anaerolineales bacterium]
MNTEDTQRNDQAREQWDQKAEFWDNLHGDGGNRFHRELVSPAVEHLLAIKPGEQILDIACGSGVMARRMAALGANVTAVDFSPELIARAQARKQVRGNPVQYQVVDATDEQTLAHLGEGRFAAVTCTMALMDMPVVAPLYRAIARLLKPDGRFVFATSHPAFNSNNPIFLTEVEDQDGRLIQANYLKISAYLNIPPALAVGADGEPSPHHYYHRPLSELLGEAFKAGLVLDALEEPAFSPDADARPLSWSSYPQIPPILAGRFKLK